MSKSMRESVLKDNPRGIIRKRAKKISGQGNQFSIINTSHWLWQYHWGKLSKSEPNRGRQDLNTDKSQVKKITVE